MEFATPVARTCDHAVLHHIPREQAKHTGSRHDILPCQGYLSVCAMIVECRHVYAERHPASFSGDQDTAQPTYVRESSHATPDTPHVE
jgi:hypothetical protein